MPMMMKNGVMKIALSVNTKHFVVAPLSKGKTSSEILPGRRIRIQESA